MASPVHINEKEVGELLSIDDLIRNVESALKYATGGAAGGVVQPVRTVIPVAEYGGFLGIMPCYSRSHNALSCKMVSFYPSNASKGLPTHMATIMLYEPSSGCLLATIEAETITALRTAAVSAVATKYLRSHDNEAKVLAILGSGVQARSHAKVLSLLFSFSEVRVWSRNAANAQKCAADIGGTAIHSAEEAVSGADVIITATFSTTPVVKAEWLKPSAHINAVGACRPDWQEVDAQIMQTSRVYVDNRQAAAMEAGDIILSKASIEAELGEVISGKVSVPTTTSTTVFKSLGLAVEDAVAARLVYDTYMSKLIQN